MPAPILTNMYTSLQKGMDGFEQCRHAVAAVRTRAYLPCKILLPY